VGKQDIRWKWTVQCFCFTLNYVMYFFFFSGLMQMFKMQNWTLKQLIMKSSDIFRTLHLTVGSWSRYLLCSYFSSFSLLYLWHSPRNQVWTAYSNLQKGQNGAFMKNCELPSFYPFMSSHDMKREHTSTALVLW